MRLASFEDVFTGKIGPHDNVPDKILFRPATQNQYIRIRRRNSVLSSIPEFVPRTESTPHQGHSAV